MMTGWVLAVDFGTCFTSAAIADVGTGQVEVLEIESSRYLPCLVYRDPDGQLLVGRAAVGQAAIFPERAERLPKRALASGRRQVRLGQASVAVVDLVAAVLAKVAAEALRRHNQQPPQQVVLTHPARWGPAELALLGQAADGAGLPEPLFLPEPVAAACHASSTLEPGTHVAVYDLGGGTLDTAVLRRTPSGYELVGAPGGDPHLGGEDFDEALRELVGTHARALDPHPWRALCQDEDRRRARAGLRREITEAKETLSEHLAHSLYVEGYTQPIRITRGEFEASIEDSLQASVAELRRTMDEAALSPSDLAAVFVTGGSSRIPRVTELVGAACGMPPQVGADPKAVVVQGALHWVLTNSHLATPQSPVHPEGRDHDINDNAASEPIVEPDSLPSTHGRADGDGNGSNGG